MSTIKQTVQPKKFKPNPADGAEAALQKARGMDNQQERWEELRRVLLGKMISCNDCRGMRDATVMLMDLLTNRLDSDAYQTTPNNDTVEHPNSTVKMIPAMESEDDGGEEVAPGVKIYPPSTPVPSP